DLGDVGGRAGRPLSPDRAGGTAAALGEARSRDGRSARVPAPFSAAHGRRNHDDRVRSGSRRPDRRAAPGPSPRPAPPPPAALGGVAPPWEALSAGSVVAADGRLGHVVSLRELLMADRDALISAVAPKRQLITVAPMETRSEAARLIGKYNLLALPVVDETR